MQNTTQLHGEVVQFQLTNTCTQRELTEVMYSEARVAESYLHAYFSDVFEDSTCGKRLLVGGTVRTGTLRLNGWIQQSMINVDKYTMFPSKQMLIRRRISWAS